MLAGFARCQSNPASSAVLTSSGCAYPLNAMSWTAARPLARSVLATSYPLIPGSPMSQRTMSGGFERAFSIALGPS